jgi:hypothetical protein
MAVPTDWLKRRTTYREFMGQWLGDENGVFPAELIPRLEELEAKVQAKMLPGDELWEFEHGNQDFAMTWGLAIVRDEQIVESWVEWKS